MQRLPTGCGGNLLQWLRLGEAMSNLLVLFLNLNAARWPCCSALPPSKRPFVPAVQLLPWRTHAVRPPMPSAPRTLRCPPPPAPVVTPAATARAAETLRVLGGVACAPLKTPRALPTNSLYNYSCKTTVKGRWPPTVYLPWPASVAQNESVCIPLPPLRA